MMADIIMALRGWLRWVNNLRGFATFMLGLIFLSLMIACSKDSSGSNPEVTIVGVAIEAEFGNRIDPDNLDNYASQDIPDYIKKDNSLNNPVTDKGATLGRVLFYDKNLSIDNTLACASCHIQKFAFSDTSLVSKGVEGGVTGRHSMRLINARFASETKFFWDERATSLEDQTTMPIKDHGELGFSGQNGRPDFDDLLDKIARIDYYKELFALAFGDSRVTEDRMQKALGQFVRSIQSFDSKYDEGYETDFSNYNESERRGLRLFTDTLRIAGQIRIGGGLQCASCHRPPEFDIDPAAGNNGVVGVANKPGEVDLDNTRAPTLRDIAGTNGELNGPLMHDGSAKTFEELVELVGRLEEGTQMNPKRDPRFGPSSFNLQITDQEKDDLIAFLKTLSGKDVYTNAKWSDPFR